MNLLFYTMEDFQQKEFCVLVKSNEQITSAYPELFENCNVDTFQFQIESKKDSIDYSNEPRLILLPSGIVSITCPKDNNYVWGDYDSQEYIELLTQLNKLIAETNHKPANVENSSISKIINDKQYSINLFPFNDVKGSQVLMNEIDKKMLIYTKRFVK